MTWKKWWQTVFDGALGGLTFGWWHSVVTRRQMNEYNRQMEKEYKVKMPDW